MVTFFIQGDLNGRIGKTHDFLAHDKFDDVFGIQNNYNLPTRNSEDTFVNTRGRELLGVCKTNDYTIINGRKVGNYTSHPWNGSSVVDDLITPDENYDNILNFSVGAYTPWLSDHCPLHTTIISNGTIKHNSTTKLYNRETGFLWNERCKETFKANLVSDEIKSRFESVMIS